MDRHRRSTVGIAASRRCASGGVPLLAGVSGCCAGARDCEAAHRAENAAAAEEANPGADQTEPRRQPSADGRTATPIPDRLAWLLRLLPDALGASRPGLVDSATTPLLPVEAVETGQNPLRGTPPAGRGQRPGGPNRRQLTRAMAPQPQPRPERRPARRLLRLARPPETQRTPTRLTSRTAVVRTRTPGGVTGKAREGIPMSIIVLFSEGSHGARNVASWCELHAA